MEIKLSPQYNDVQLTVTKTGEVFLFSTDDGTPDINVDLSTTPYEEPEDGWTWREECLWIASAVRRVNGELKFTIIYPVDYGEGQAYPPPLIDPPDGILPFPERTDSLRSGGDDLS